MVTRRMQDSRCSIAQKPVMYLTITPSRQSDTRLKWAN